MNIVGALGVLLTGDSSGMVKASQEGAKALSNVQSHVSSLSHQLPLLQTAFSTALGVTAVSAISSAVRAWMPLEEKVAGLSRIVGDTGVVKQIQDIAGAMQDFAGISNERTLRMAESIKMMGAENKNLAGTLSLVQGIQMAAGGMIGERQAFRMLQMYQSGNTRFFERYVAELKGAVTAEQKQAAIQDWIQKGMQKTAAEMNTTTGQLRRYRNAQNDVLQEAGALFTRVLQLERVFAILANGMRSVRDAFINSSESTKGWIAASVIVIGVVLPLVSVFRLLAPVFISIGTAALHAGKMMLTAMLPAVVAVAGAFLGWNLGKTLDNLKIGGTTIGQYMKELSMTILKGWEWLWDILPLKVAIAFSKIQVKIAEFINGQADSGLLAKLETQQSTLSQRESVREESWAMNDKWLKKEQEKANAAAITSWQQFADQFSKNAGDSLGSILDTLGTVGQKISSGDLMKSLLGVFPESSLKMPQLPAMPSVGEGSRTAPQYASALERGTAGAYTVQMQQVQRLSKIQTASEDTADNTETTNALLEEFLSMMPTPAAL